MSDATLSEVKEAKKQLAIEISNLCKQFSQRFGTTPYVSYPDIMVPDGKGGWDIGSATKIEIHL